MEIVLLSKPNKFINMKKIIISTFLIFGVVGFAFSQKYFTKEGKITFVSQAPLETIEAENNTSTFVMDLATGKIQMATLIKGFHFEKALMEEHFNENYMESDKFPKATFKGKFDGATIDVSQDGVLMVPIVGLLTIHGETKRVEMPASFTVTGGKVKARAQMRVKLSDYKVAIPKVVKDNISEEVKITVEVNLEVLNK